MLRDGQSKAMGNMGSINPLASMPGFDAMRAQQEAFLKAMTGGVMGGGKTPDPAPAAKEEPAGDELEDIKAQLKTMQDMLSKMGK